MEHITLVGVVHSQRLWERIHSARTSQASGRRTSHSGIKTDISRLKLAIKWNAIMEENRVRTKVAIV